MPPPNKRRKQSLFAATLECPKVTYEEEIDQRMYCDLDQRVMEAWGDCGLEDEPLDNSWVSHKGMVAPSAIVIPITIPTSTMTINTKAA